MILLTQTSNQLARFKTVAARVFHGRGKAFEGYEDINVEWYPPYLFVQNFDETLSEHLQQELRALFLKHEEIEAILIQSRGWPDSVTEVFLTRREIALPLSFPVSLPGEVTCEVTLGKNRNTGVFPDMRTGWHWVGDNSENKRVLNLFCYTGVFSLFALKGNAAQVDNVDMAPGVLKTAQRNHQLNGLNQGKAAFFRRDILRSDRWFEGRHPYHLIIIDPPPYQKKAFHGWRDYERLLDMAFGALAPGGQFFMTLNNPQVSLEEFLQDIRTHFPQNEGVEVLPSGEEIREQDDRKGLKIAVVQF